MTIGFLTAFAEKNALPSIFCLQEKSIRLYFIEVDTAINYCSAFLRYMFYCAFSRL